jgi:FkbM family methyltransferase
VKVFFLTVVALAAAYIWYPPARLLGFVAMGRSPVCPVGKALKSRAHLEELGHIKDRIFLASKLVKEDSGLELWDTPKGQFWIPKGSRYVLPFNLAEMERRVYGDGEHFVQPGDIVLDCGASDGDFTREALKAGAAKVIALEITPSSIECLRRNLAAEIAAGKVVVYPKGVWNKDDELTMYVDETNFAANTVVGGGEGLLPSVRVPLTTIDKVVAELRLPQVNFIKMDVEGAEANAIAGARETITRFKPRLAIAAEHKPEDQFELPNAVRKIRADYQMKCVECLELQGRIQPDVLVFW